MKKEQRTEAKGDRDKEEENRSKETTEVEDQVTTISKELKMLRKIDPLLESVRNKAYADTTGSGP